MTDVSFLTPVGPGEGHWLERCKASLDQLYSDHNLLWEHVVVHDTDARGPAWARNTGLLHAKGKWVALLDADDEVEPDFLAKLGLWLAYLGDSVDWLTFEQWTVVDEAGQPVAQPPNEAVGKYSARGHRRSAFQVGRSLPGSVCAYLRQHSRLPCLPAGLIFKAEALWRAGGWPALPYNEDVGVWCAVDQLPRGRGGYVMDGYGYRSRRRAGQLTQTTTEADRKLGWGWNEKRWQLLGCVQT